MYFNSLIFWYIFCSIPFYLLYKNFSNQSIFYGYDHSFSIFVQTNNNYLFMMIITEKKSLNPFRKIMKTQLHFQRKDFEKKIWRLSFLYFTPTVYIVIEIKTEVIYKNRKKIFSFCILKQIFFRIVFLLVHWTQLTLYGHTYIHVQYIKTIKQWSVSMNLNSFQLWTRIPKTVPQPPFSKDWRNHFWTNLVPALYQKVSNTSFCVSVFCVKKHELSLFVMSLFDHFWTYFIIWTT